MSFFTVYLHFSEQIGMSFTKLENVNFHTETMAQPSAQDTNKDTLLQQHKVSFPNRFTHLSHQYMENPK